MEKRIDELYKREVASRVGIELLKAQVRLETDKRLVLEEKIVAMGEELLKLRGEKMELEGQVDTLKQQIVELNASVALKESRIAELENERNSRTGTGPL